MATASSVRAQYGASSVRAGMCSVSNTARASEFPIGCPPSSRRLRCSGRDVLPERLARGSAPCWARARGSDHPCRKLPRLTASLPRSAQRSAPPLATARPLTIAGSPPPPPPRCPPPRLDEPPRCGEGSRCAERIWRRAELLRPPHGWRPPSSRCGAHGPIRRCLRCPASRSAAISSSIERSISW